MPDVTRRPAEAGGSGRDEDRDRTIETLLVTGLDLYFAGDYERAIHAWTRVLFFDRTQARARAYIERARSVLAERQRETDELLHRGLAALDAGDTDRARSLLASAVERGGAVEAAEVALERVVRLDVAGGADGAPPMQAAMAPPSGRPAGPRSRRVVPFVLAMATVPLLFIAGAFALGWDPLGDWSGELRREPAPLRMPPLETPLPHPPLAELAIRRARGLFSRGHLYEALAELDNIHRDDPRRHEADRLEADVQRALLDAVETPSTGSAHSPAAARP